MTPTLAEYIEAGKALSAEDRLEAARQLILSIEQDDDAGRLEALRAAVSVADASIAAGRGIRVPASELRAYLRRRGERAAQIADAQSG